MMRLNGFCIWLTGIPASGKSSIARELAALFRQMDLPVVWLESDAMRTLLMPDAGYSDAERGRFYRLLADLGGLLTDSGINVIIDATANKRRYRDYARSIIHRFFEIAVQTPPELCVARDPKGLYAKAAAGETSFLPGIQSSYEPPIAAELSVSGQDSPAENARHIYHLVRDAA